MVKINALKKGVSYLFWQAPKGNINPKTLGWIRPDGIINFQTAKAAQTYAKKRVMEALHTPKPFERAVFVKDNQILSQIDGNQHHVHFDMKNIRGQKDVSIVHGHPTGTPLSDQDYNCLMTSPEFKSVVAYNKHGEYSKMTKKSPHINLCLFPVKDYEAARIGMDNLLKRTINLKKNCKGMTNAEILATEDGQKLAKFAQKVLTRINNLWANNEKAFGIKYKCNYSKLI